MPVEAVLFDFDGVLLDSEPLHFACWRELLEPLGVPMDWETYRRHCVGVSDRETLALFGARANPAVPLDRLWAEYGRKNELFRERAVTDPPLPADTRRLLDELRDYRLAVVSSSGRAEVEPVLEAAGIRRYFGVVICGEDVKRHKPDPEPYRLAAERLGVRHALVVEDSAAGVASGEAAGFEVLCIQEAAQTARLVRQRLGLRPR